MAARISGDGRARSPEAARRVTNPAAHRSDRRERCHNGEQHTWRQLCVPHVEGIDRWAAETYLLVNDLRGQA